MHEGDLQLDRPIFGPAVQVSSVSLKAEAGNTARMSLEGKDRLMTCSVVNFVKADHGISCSGKELLVGGYFQTIHLRIGMAYRSAAYPAWCLPESYFVVVPRRCEDDAHSLSRVIV